MESEDDEWELCYDDGFVYKRKRRRLNPPPPEPSSEPDQEAADKLRKQRKKRTLLKLKSKYQNEIVQWENLSNTLRSLHISSSTQLQQQRQLEQTLSLPSTSSSSHSSLLDDLLFQVEAQEAIIHNISNLCDVAEGMCFKQEQQFKQSLFDLPIWISPLELMQVLCYDD
uniref:Uncharacterized protein LOC101503015 n=1 Tax=Cicer arietinum TaxID=3827 RepID=A0A1S2XGW6_CICAR|nr:uncharacterized protein LOC101503015 [Cicer arietinum]